jgi:hypothetical protein
LFFNPQQTGTVAWISQSIAEHGTPVISAEGDAITVKVGALEDVQTIFALAAIDEAYELAGLVMYVRTDIQNVLVLHIAVAEHFSATGPDAEAMLVMRLVDTVRRAARRLKGVRSVTVIYSPAGRRMKMAV